LAGEGKGILFISSELPEILGVCDRIYVMSDGKITGELDREEASQEKIMKHIINLEQGGHK
jgi:putative multiple sugar transport system ATP-binding protein